jgi:type IV secretion system protein VirB2
MNNKITTNPHKRANRLFAVAMLLLVAITFTEPAWATLTVGQSMLQTVITWLTGTAVAVATVAFCFVGYRMMFAAAQWKDVAPVFWGSVIIGAAGAIAAVVA